jgi:hypothetical protein
MLNALSIIAERKISQAIHEGMFDVSHWKGRPLPEEDDSFVPADMRMAYKVLKNAGYLPPEVETRKEIAHLEELIATTEDEHLRLKQMKKLNVLIMKLNIGRKESSLHGGNSYYQRVVEKITVSSKK